MLAAMDTDGVVLSCRGILACWYFIRRKIIIREANIFSYLARREGSGACGTEIASRRRLWPAH
jgi:hypothetical protein